MSANSIRWIFLSGAIFNLVIGVILALAAPVLFGLFRVTPAPTEVLFTHLFGWLVIVFGLAYFWVSRDPANNISLIRLGIIGKLGVVAVAAIDVVLGVVSWQFVLLAAVDLLYAILFWRALKNL